MHHKELKEFYTGERCYITELINSPVDADLSIGRARVEPGITTERHKLKGTAERYIIISGSGIMEVGGHADSEVSAGDLVLIPPDTPQRITNSGKSDLVFLCICTPGFRSDCYIKAE